MKLSIQSAFAKETCLRGISGINLIIYVLECSPPGMVPTLPVFSLKLFWDRPVPDLPQTLVLVNISVWSLVNIVCVYN